MIKSNTCRPQPPAPEAFATRLQLATRLPSSSPPVRVSSTALRSAPAFCHGGLFLRLAAPREIDAT